MLYLHLLRSTMVKKEWSSRINYRCQGTELRLRVERLMTYGRPPVSCVGRQMSLNCQVMVDPVSYKTYMVDIGCLNGRIECAVTSNKTGN